MVGWKTRPLPPTNIILITTNATTTTIIKNKNRTLMWGRACWNQQWRAHLGLEWIFESERKVVNNGHDLLIRYICQLSKSHRIWEQKIQKSRTGTWIIVRSWGIWPSLAPAKKSRDEVRSWPLTAPENLCQNKQTQRQTQNLANLMISSDALGW